MTLHSVNDFHKAFQAIFLMVYAKNKSKMLSSIVYRRFSEEEAEDVLSEASSAMWAKLNENVKQESCFGVSFTSYQPDCVITKQKMELALVKHFWVFIRNKAIDYHRQKANKLATIQSPLADIEHDHLDQFSITLPGPAEELHLKQKISAALSHISPEEWSIVLYIHYEGKSSAEVAALLGMNENTVRTTLRRSLIKMTAAIKDDNMDSCCDEIFWRGQ